MGWDAFIYGPKGGRINNKKLYAAFDKAGKEVTKISGCCDIHIYRGGRLVVLDCSGTGEMLNKAGINAWDASKLFRVRDLKFNWDFEYDPKLADYYWSARKAIEICQKYDLTIRFSW